MSGNAKRRREAHSLRRSDKQLERNRCWDELNEFYSACAGVLYQHKSLAALAHDKDLINYVADKTTLLTNIRSLAQDLVTLNTELQMLYGLHKGKTKGAKTPEEMMEAFGHAERYNLFIERHNGVVLPTAFYILEAFQQAETARDLARAAAGQPSAQIEAMAQSSADTGPIDVPHRELPAAAEVAAQSSLPAGYTLQ